MSDPIHSSVEQGIRTITFDRPPGNLLDAAMRAKLIEILQIANHDWETRVIVLESAQPDVFCLGDDSSSPKPPPREPYDSFGVPSTPMALDRHFLRAIWDAKWPVIAKVAGTAAGEGLLMAALADVAVVSETAEIGLPDARGGVIAGLSILRRCMPEQTARYLLLSARLIKAGELRALGAGMRIVPRDALDDAVARLAGDIASLDPHLLRHLKIAMTEIEQADPLAGHAVEQRYTALSQARMTIRHP
jgi:enoyl-CoA hydratase/carnithine racemase